MHAPAAHDVPPESGAGGRRRPTASSCWTGALFAIGSTCFALGSLPTYFDAVAPSTASWTFFVGSIFFTTAALLQLLGAPTDGPSDRAAGRPRGVRAAWWMVSHPSDRRAAAVQFVGTLFFNLSTFAATRSAMSVQQERRLVWVPDVYGSICFLVASAACWALARRARPPAPWTTLTIAGVNLAGSIAFGASAVGARLLRTDGETANIALVNAGTFAGAVCFFVGALLLPVDDVRGRFSP